MADKPSIQEPIVGSPTPEPTLDSKRVDLEKAIADARANIVTLEAGVKAAEATANKAWEQALASRDREDGTKFNRAEDARLGAVAKVADAGKTLKRLEDALADLANVAKRESVNPLLNFHERAIKAVCKGDADGLVAIANELRSFRGGILNLLEGADGLEGVTYNVGLRSMQDGKMALNATGASVSRAPHGPWFKRMAVGRKGGGGGGARTAGSHYTYTVDGATMSEADFVAAYADKVWSGEKLQHVLDNGKGENRIRNSLRIAKELGIVPEPIS